MIWWSPLPTCPSGQRGRQKRNGWPAGGTRLEQVLYCTVEKVKKGDSAEPALAKYFTVLWKSEKVCEKSEKGWKCGTRFDQVLYCTVKKWRSLKMIEKKWKWCCMISECQEILQCQNCTSYFLDTYPLTEVKSHTVMFVTTSSVHVITLPCLNLCVRLRRCIPDTRHPKSLTLPYTHPASRRHIEQ